MTTLAVAAVTVVFRGPIYPAPQKAHQQAVDTAPNLLLTTLAPSAQAPFSQADWPNPARRATLQADIPPNLLLTPGLAPPFRPVEFQLLLKTARAVQFDPQNLLTGILAPAQVAVPFYQTDWPKPARQASQPGDVWPNLLGTTLAPAVDQAPFQPFDWPNTRGARVQDQWLAPNLQTGTLAPAVVASPFTPYDFTQPRVAYRVSTEIWPASLALLSAPVAIEDRKDGAKWPLKVRQYLTKIKDRFYWFSDESELPKEEAKPLQAPAIAKADVPQPVVPEPAAPEPTIAKSAEKIAADISEKSEADARAEIAKREQIARNNEAILKLMI